VKLEAVTHPLAIPLLLGWRGPMSRSVRPLYQTAGLKRSRSGDSDMLCLSCAEMSSRPIRQAMMAGSGQPLSPARNDCCPCWGCAGLRSELRGSELAGPGLRQVCEQASAAQPYRLQPTRN